VHVGCDIYESQSDIIRHYQTPSDIWQTSCIVSLNLGKIDMLLLILSCKLKNPESLEPEKTLADHIKLLGDNFEDFAMEFREKSGWC